MKSSDARLTHLSVWLATATGLLYGGLLYFGEGEDEFGPVAHAWLPTAQASHVVAVPLLVFVFGLLWHHHIVHKVRSGAKCRRLTGLLLLSQMIAMIASGYALQVSVEEAWRTAWVWAHVVSSVLFGVAFVVHLLVRIKPDRA